MEAEFFPLYSKPGINTGESWVFIDESGEIEIEDASVEIADILVLSNGRNTLPHIVSELGKKYDLKKIQRIVDDLRTLGILIDKTEAIYSRHGYTDNPTVFANEVTQMHAEHLVDNDTFVPKSGDLYPLSPRETQVSRVAAERESCRNFELSGLNLEDLSSVLDAAYSKEHPVPSAGGLYPVRLYAIIKEGALEIPGGFYQYDHTTANLVQFNQKPDWEKLKHVFNSERLLHNAPVILVAAADFSRHLNKYSNRGYRYSTLEAGQVAQNINLAATELGLGTLEYGGFQDKKLSHELDLGEYERPLISVGIGKKSVEIYDSTDMKQIENLVGTDKPVKSVSIDLDPETSEIIDFFRATAVYTRWNNDTRLLSSGTARSMDEAKIKAIAEAYERYKGSAVFWDITAPASKLTEQWLDPGNVMPLTAEQIGSSELLMPFDPDKELNWIRATHADGMEILVPIDLVFYPIAESLINRKLVSDTTSSGMAAHPDEQEAIKRATLELIERDATMRLWFSKQSPNRINTEALPEYIKRRQDFWIKHNRKLEILDLSTKGVAVAHAIIRSTEKDQELAYPFFVNGAAASNTSFEEAALKAVYEAENILVSASYFKDMPKITPKDVRSPEDHGRLYYYEDYKNEIEWLWQGPIVDSIPETDSRSVVDKYNPLVVKLSQDSEYLKVVRVICPELVPISFGYGNEYYSHPAAGNPSLKPGQPHFFA
jgi:thiazole/oxazole-forming peptide maturase SagD family component